MQNITTKHKQDMYTLAGGVSLSIVFFIICFSTSFPLLRGFWSIDTRFADWMFGRDALWAGRGLLGIGLVLCFFLIIRGRTKNALGHEESQSFVNWRLVYLVPIVLLVGFPIENFSLSTSLLRSEVTARANYERALIEADSQEVAVVESLDEFSELSRPRFDGSVGGLFAFLVPDGQVNRINIYLAQVEETAASDFEKLFNDASLKLGERVAEVDAKISVLRAEFDRGCPFMENGEPTNSCLRNLDFLRNQMAQLNSERDNIVENGLDFAGIGINERLAMSAVSVVRSDQREQYQTYELTLLMTVVSTLILLVFVLKECVSKRPIAALLMPALIGGVVFCLLPMVIPSAWLSLVGLSSLGQLYYFMPIGHFIAFFLFCLVGMALALFVRDTRLLRSVVWKSSHRNLVLKSFLSRCRNPAIAILIVFLLVWALKAFLVDKTYSASLGDLESRVGFVDIADLDNEAILQEASRCDDGSGKVGIVFPTADDCSRNFEDDVFGALDLWFEETSNRSAASIAAASAGYDVAGQGYIDSLNGAVEGAIPFSLSTYTALQEGQGQSGISPSFDHNFSVCWYCAIKWVQRKVKRRADGSYIDARFSALQAASTRLQTAYDTGNASLPELEQIALNETAKFINRMKSETSLFLLATLRINDILNFILLSSFLIAALKFFGHLFVRAALDDDRVRRTYNMHFPHGPKHRYPSIGEEREYILKTSSGSLKVAMEQGEFGTCRWGYDPDSTNLHPLTFHLPLAEIPKRIINFSYFYRKFTPISEGTADVELKNAAGSSLTLISLKEGEAVRFDLSKLYGVIGSPKLSRKFSFEPTDLLRFKMRHFTARGKGKMVFRTHGVPSIRWNKNEGPSSIYRLLVWPSEGGMELVSDSEATGVFFGRVQFKCREVGCITGSGDYSQNLPIVFDSDDGDFAKSLRPFFLAFSLFLPF